MISWWYAMTGLEQFFAIVAIPATIILVLQTIMTVISFDSGGVDGCTDIDGDGSIDHVEGVHDFGDGGLQMFTVRGFVAFFAIFGWSGLVMLKGGMNVSLSFVLAAIFGLISMALVALAFMMFARLQSNGAVNIQSSIGKTGTVYLSIPAARRGIGKVSIMVGGALTELDAVTDEKQDILFQTGITVVAVTGGNTAVVISK